MSTASLVEEIERMIEHLDELLLDHLRAAVASEAEPVDERRFARARRALMKAAWELREERE